MWQSQPILNSSQEKLTLKNSDFKFSPAGLQITLDMLPISICSGPKIH